MDRDFRPPSAMTQIFCLLVLLTVVFVRCGPARTESAPPSEPSPSAGAAAPPAAPPESAPLPAASASAAPPAERHRYVVATIGDSLTDARSHGGKFLDYLQKRCPESQFDNYGKGGDMVNQMHRRFARDVLGTGGEKKPAYTHLIVFGGVNDLYSDMTAGRTPDHDAADLAAMYRLGREHGMKIVALTVTPWGGFQKYFNAKRSADTKKLNDWIRSQLSQKAVDYLIDANLLLGSCDPEKLCPEDAAPFKDGIHFGPGGHDKIGKALHEKVFSDCR
jgi:lysophospholipase L1-like esterase